MAGLLALSDKDLTELASGVPLTCAAGHLGPSYSLAI